MPMTQHSSRLWSARVNLSALAACSARSFLMLGALMLSGCALVPYGPEAVSAQDPRAAYVLAVDSYLAGQYEKAANIFLNQVQPYGAFGRLWLSGTESEIDSAAEAAVGALNALSGV